MNKEQQNKYLELAIEKHKLYEDWATIHQDHSFFPSYHWNDYAHDINKKIQDHNKIVKQTFPKNVELMANFILLGF